MNSWLFPPQTREVQFDEKWSFVGKKQEHRDSNDRRDACRGEVWDHVAFDPEHRLVVAVLPGRRTVAATRAVIREFQRRTQYRMPRLITADDHAPYATELLAAYGDPVIPMPTRQDGHDRRPFFVAPDDLLFASVCKIWRKGRPTRVVRHITYGTEEMLQAALAVSRASRSINTSFIERHNLTDRSRNARKARRTREFSKKYSAHRALTFFTMFSYNFCWPVRTLWGRSKNRGEVGVGPTPAMAAGLADRIWTLDDWLTYPAVQRN